MGTWTCLEPPVFAWYWVYPSRSSCQNYCGIIVQEDWDCSCSSDCFYYGNCCQDVDYYCDEILFWRKSGNKLSKNNKMKNSANKPNPALPALPSKLPKELTKKTEEKPAVAKRTNIDNKNLDADKNINLKEKENVKEKRVMIENKEKKKKTTNEKKEKVTNEKVVAPKIEKKTDEKVVAPNKEKKPDAKILELRENDVKAKRTDSETEGKEEQKTEFKNENKLTEEDKEFK